MVPEGGLGAETPQRRLSGRRERSRSRPPTEPTEGHPCPDPCECHHCCLCQPPATPASLPPDPSAPWIPFNLCSSQCPAPPPRHRDPPHLWTGGRGPACTGPGATAGGHTARGWCPRWPSWFWQRGRQPAQWWGPLGSRSYQPLCPASQPGGPPLAWGWLPGPLAPLGGGAGAEWRCVCPEIGRASCRERVCLYV